MNILVNEQACEVNPTTSIFNLRDKLKPGADVVVRNGAVCTEDLVLREGDSVVFICRGETPPEEELEALMASRHTPGVHWVLKKSTVGIAGLGGLGSAVAVALARIGVGRLVLVDFDVVEPSNLNRQQYFVDQIGLLKTEALAANLSRINPYVKVETHALRLTNDNVAETFGEVDVLVEAFDLATSKAMIVESFSCAFPHKTIVVATGLAGHEPSNTVRTMRIGKSLVVVGDRITAAQPGTGLMAPRVGVAAHHQANAVLRILLGEDPEG
jgi:sulfur carrier protein ThiS adenylyltransferase